MLGISLSARTRAWFRAFAAASIAAATSGPVLAAALPACPGPGITGDDAASRGLRFKAGQEFGAVAVALDGSSGGTYTFDAELRRSTGFIGATEAVLVGASAMVPGDLAHPYPTALLDFGSIGVSGSDTFTLAFTNVAGPGSLYFETHGIGSQATCADVDETEENDVADPTVRADPAGFRVLPPIAISCAGPGITGDNVAFRGLRFTPGQDFGTVAVALDGSSGGTYTFDAELRRSTGFLGPTVAVLSGVSAEVPGSVANPYPLIFLDFGRVAVSGSDTFALAFTNVAGPGSLYLETHGIGSQGTCADVDETEENDVADPTVRADPASFFVFAPEPSMQVACAAVAAALGVLTRRRRS
jgi:hypothetical protein